MNRLPTLALQVAIATGTAWLSLSVAAQQPNRDTKASAAWEYKVVPRYQILQDQNLANHETLQRKLNEDFGAAGWELCTVDSPVYIFRRPK